MKEPIIRIMKRADKSRNRIIIPQFIIDKFGKDYFIEIYADETIKLVPTNRKG